MTTRKLPGDGSTKPPKFSPTSEQIECASEAFGGITSVEWASAAQWEKEEVRAGMREALEALEAFEARQPSKAEVERDAALAAVERIRALHRPNDAFPEGCDYCDTFDACDTRAALDGVRCKECRGDDEDDDRSYKMTTGVTR